MNIRPRLIGGNFFAVVKNFDANTAIIGNVVSIAKNSSLMAHKQFLWETIFHSCIKLV